MHPAMRACLLLLLCLILPACSVREDIVIPGSLQTYIEKADGTYVCGEYTYAYRLVIRGKLPAAAHEITYVYLSNIPEISSTRAAMASGLSSNIEEYFSPAEAILVDWQ